MNPIQEVKSSLTKRELACWILGYITLLDGCDSKSKLRAALHRLHWSLCNQPEEDFLNDCITKIVNSEEFNIVFLPKEKLS